MLYRTDYPPSSVKETEESRPTFHYVLFMSHKMTFSDYFSCIIFLLKVILNSVYLIFLLCMGILCLPFSIVFDKAITRIGVLCDYKVFKLCLYLEAPAALPSEQLLSPLMNKMETR